MSSRQAESRGQEKDKVRSSLDDTKQPLDRMMHACGGEVNVSAVAAAVNDADAPRVRDVKVMTFGDGPPRCTQEAVDPEAIDGRALLSTSLSRVSHASAQRTLPPYPQPMSGDGGVINIRNFSDGPKGNSALKELHKFHRLLRGRYMWTILLATTLGLLGATIGYRKGVKLYRSTGAIRVLPTPQRLIYPDDNGAIPVYETFVDAQMSLLRSQRVIEQALDEAPWRQVQSQPDKSDAAVARLSDSLDVSRQGEIVWVRVADADPRVAVAGVDATISAYLKVYAQNEARSDDKYRELREEVRAKLRAESNALRDEIQEIAKPYGTDDLKAQFEYKQQARNELETRIRDVQMDLATGGIHNEPASKPAITRPEDVMFRYQDARMTQLLAQKAQAEQQLRTVLVNSGVKSLLYRQAEAALEAVQRQITLYTAQFVNYLENTPASAVPGATSPRELEARRQALLVLYQKEDDEMRTVGKRQLRIAELREKAADVKQRLDEASRAIERSEVEKPVMGHIAVMSQADRPLGPFRDTRLATASAGGFGGMGLGIAAMLLFGLVKGKIERPDDADGQLPGVSMLGMVPVLAEEMTDPTQVALAAHCVHEIRTRLQIFGQGQHRPVLGITSATAGAGKTSLTLALGLSFAAGNQRTLLIDCDFVGGGLTRKLDAIARRRLGTILLNEGCITQKQLEEGLWCSSQSGQPVGETLLSMGYTTREDLSRCVDRQLDESMGLLDAIEGEDLESCTAQSTVEGLWVMPLGGATAQDAVSLSPMGLRRLLDRASKSFDVIIVDTGPILGSLEASIVASQSDAMVLAVAKGEPRVVVERSASELSSLGARFAGTVFNRAREKDVLRHASSSYALRSVSESTLTECREMPGTQRLGPLARAVVSVSPSLSADARRARGREKLQHVAASPAD